MIQTIIPFNRTSLELKPCSSVSMRRTTSASFNRTSLELKHILDWTNNKTLVTFNRTSLELKPLT